MSPPSKDKRDLLDVLKAELQFVERGGYRRTARAAWRPQFIFQDSPTCMNFDPAQPPRPCSDCVLMQLVPEDQQRRKIACRFIPLNEKGETIDSFYRSGTPDELEATLRTWLRASIARLEERKHDEEGKPHEEGKRLEKPEHPEESSEPEIHVKAKAAPVE
ncbi:MAG: hypothetical protein WCE61_20890 [Candidatus Acidiferrum sp.]